MKQNMSDMRENSQIKWIALIALLSNRVNGNSIDKLTAANDQLEAYLTGYISPDELNGG